MATSIIEKKFLFYQTLAAFNADLDAGYVKNKSIAFIKDKQYLWTNGQFFYCNVDSTEDLALKANQTTVLTISNKTLTLEGGTNSTIQLDIEDIDGLADAIAAGATTLVEKKTGHVTVTESTAADGHKVYTVEEDDIASMAALPTEVVEGGSCTMKSDKATLNLTTFEKGNDGTYSQAADKTIDIECATTGLAGLMSPEDKVRMDSIYGGNLPLVTPTLTGTWTYYKNDGTTEVSLSGTTIEEGYKAKWSGTYKWNSASGKKNPTKVVSGNWATLTADGVNSDTYTSSVISSNTTIKIQIGAPKTGLMVSGTNVQPASGDDTTQATTSMSFSTRIYKGVVTSKTPTEAEVKALNNELGGKARTINSVTADGTQYWMYAYPKSLGTLSKIIQDGATPVLGAFTRIDTMTITNAAGYSVPLYIYISNNPGAFTNASLQFS